MKKTFKKLSALLLALLMCFSMAACGDDTGTDKPANDDGNDAAATLDDTFVYAIGGAPQYLDPAVGSD